MNTQEKTKFLFEMHYKILAEIGRIEELAHSLSDEEEKNKLLFCPRTQRLFDLVEATREKRYFKN